MKYCPVSLAKKYSLLASILLLFALAACEDEPGCVTDNTNQVIIAFFQIDDTAQRNSATVFIPGVEAVGVGRYTIDTGDVVPERSEYSLVLNPEEDATTFYVFQENGTIDTVLLRYQRQQQVISPDCGPTQRYFGLTVDEEISTFDSVRVVEPELSNLNRTNLQIYICQDTFYTQEIVFDFQEKEPDTTLVRTDSLFVQSIQNEAGQVLLANDTVVGSLSLPINPSANRTTFTFELLAHEDEPARTETIALLYQDTTVRFAEPCRLQTRYFNLDTVSTTFDSVRFENRELAIDVPLNVRIVDFL